VNDDELIAAIQEDPEEQPELPGGMTEEAAIVAQSKDPEDFTELDWHIVNPPAARESPYGECDLGSCEKPPTHYCEMLSGRIFFGCAYHVERLIKMGVAKKKQKFEVRA